MVFPVLYFTRIFCDIPPFVVSVPKGGLGRLATWNLPGRWAGWSGVVGAATLVVEIGQPVNGE